MVQAPPVDVNDDVVVVEPTCEALPAAEGETVAVTCDFGVNVSRQHLWSSLGVELKPSSGGAVLDVLECFWLPGEAPDCSARPGYSYDGQLGRTVDVTIPNVSLAHTGAYSCHIIPADGALLTVQMSQQCVFILEDSPDSSDSGRPAEGERTTDAPTESGNKKIWPSVLGVVLGVITTVAVVVVLAFFRRRRLLPDTCCLRKGIDDKSDVNGEPGNEDKDSLTSFKSCCEEVEGSNDQGGGDDDSNNEFQDCEEAIAVRSPVANGRAILKTNWKENDSSNRSLLQDREETIGALSPVAEGHAVLETNKKENDSNDRSFIHSSIPTTDSSVKKRVEFFENKDKENSLSSQLHAREAHRSSKKKGTQRDDDDGTNIARTLAPEGQETVPSHTDTVHTATVTEEETYKNGNSNQKCEGGVETTHQRTAGDGEEADIFKM